ncbi:MAG: zeta toxin family protein [Candidatus Omnitrophica bacterium]|nr:zeta toxin family protein [Candidatus Omnitrophota bacterium]
MPNLYIIAGPNGAGKTTFAKEFLPKYAKCNNFVNADLIAMGISPFSPSTASVKAGKLLLKEIDQFIGRRDDFAVETTLAGKTYVNLIKEAKAKGYSVYIFFLWIPSLKLATERIKQRVKQGGHHVPDADVKRRLERSLGNFFSLYMPLADAWDIFDNSADEPRLIVKYNEKGLQILDRALYKQWTNLGAKHD